MFVNRGKKILQHPFDTVENGWFEIIEIRQLCLQFCSGSGAEICSVKEIIDRQYGISWKLDETVIAGKKKRCRLAKLIHFIDGSSSSRFGIPNCVSCIV